jgi:hypothetical protein
MTWRLKARSVEPMEMSVARQRLAKECFAATDMQATTKELMRTMFSIRSIWSGYKESSVENCQPISGAPREQLVARWAMALWIQVWSVNERATAWPRNMKNLHCVNFFCQETASGDCNRLWTVKCSSEWCIQVVNNCIHESTPNKYSVFGHYSSSCLFWRKTSCFFFETTFRRLDSGKTY